MANIYIKSGIASLNDVEKSGWLRLFCQCFNTEIEVAESVFKKYEVQGDNSVFCFGKVDEELVACYSGATLATPEHQLFLAMDTMSNGTIKGATVKLAQELYRWLSEQGVAAVCGFPNNNIIAIRQKKLGWRMHGAMSVYIGVPGLWRLGWHSGAEHGLWHLDRPARGFFLRKRRFIRLLGRYGLYDGARCSLVATLAAKRPGPFFVKVPDALVPNKRFGYRVLDEHDPSLEDYFEKVSRHLDCETIDVP